MALYDKWGDKTDFAFALQIFLLISDGLGGVSDMYLYLGQLVTHDHNCEETSVTPTRPIVQVFM